MTLAAGTQLGPYEILAPLGAGGMGEVYKAKDLRLDRTVAVKVLASQLSQDAEVKQRFEREARAISSLSHPHICALYDVGSEDGVEYLVMELLEGETLAARLTKGALPAAQVLRIGVEIAEALGAAHRRGIVHRDLKPGNVMLTKSGVKLLDFGLAKEHAGGATDIADTQTKSIGALTGKGTILGTLQYMAPEQLEGREADSRTDIFALGSVLYEMATGKKAFSGPSQAILISAILKEEPAPISQLQPMTPPALDHVVSKCLAKEPDERWQSAMDAAGELRWISQESSHAGVAAPARRGSRFREAALWTALLVACGAALAMWLRSSRGRPQAALVLRASIPAPEGLIFAIGGNDPHGPAVISPDGRSLVFPASSKDRGIQLWIRPLDAADPRPLAGTDHAFYPFWSPDSRAVGFFAGGKLKTVTLDGGEPLALADASSPRGGTWSRDGMIVYCPSVRSGLYAVPATGGAPQPVTHIDASRPQTTHRFPCFLPDGRHFLYYSYDTHQINMDRALPSDGIYIGSLDDGGGAARLLVRSSSDAQYASSHLLFMRKNTLYAVTFDTRSLSVSGEPVVVEDDVERDFARSKGGFTVSEGGILAYHQGRRTQWTQLAWIDRSGRSLALVGEPGILGEPEISPDGKRAAVSVLDPTSGVFQIWTYDLAAGTGSPFTFGDKVNRIPIWSADGGRVYFLSNRNGSNDLYVKSSSGSGAEEMVFHPDGDVYPSDCSRDGRFLVFMHFAGSMGEILALPLFGEKKPFPVTRERMQGSVPRLSPDSRWIAYESVESGRDEVYVAAFPGPGGKWQVSTGGGTYVRWRRDGRVLYFVSGEEELMEVDVKTGTSFEIGTPRSLFKLPQIPNTNYWYYDVAPDGNRFLVTCPIVTKQEPIAIVLNWTATLGK